MAEITTVTSEVLQAEIRRLLPTQQGFGEDLQASNVITPVIDLTSAAEGSNLPLEMQQALNFVGSVSTVTNTGTSTLANVGGFYRVRGVVPAGLQFNANIFIEDSGGSTNIIYDFDSGANSADASASVVCDITVFLRSGDILKLTNGSSVYNVAVTTQQIADINANLINPVGFVAT